MRVPVVFVPLLGLAVLAVAFNTRWFDRYGVLVTAFSVVALASTLPALTAIGLVIRTGHLGAALAWGEEGGPPPSLR